MDSSSTMKVRLPLMTYYPSNRRDLVDQIQDCIQQSEHYPVDDKQTLQFFQLTDPNSEAITSGLNACHFIGQHLQQGKKAPPHNNNNNISNLLVPHGAFCDSGPLMVKACQVLESKLRKNSTKTFLFLGTDHFSSSSVDHDPLLYYLSSADYWTTPLGNLTRNESLFALLANKSSSSKKLQQIPINNAGHQQEHSIENMIPFVQYYFGGGGGGGCGGSSSQEDKKVKMVAINCRCPSSNNNTNDVKKLKCLGKQIATALREYYYCNSSPTQQQQQQHEEIIVMATTDYTHAGPGYGEMPPPPPLGAKGGPPILSIPEYIRVRDRPVLQAIRNLDIEALWEVGSRTSMCGLGTAIVAVQIAKEFLGHHDHRQQGCLLQYVVGSDICNRGLNDQTGFASWVFC